MNKERIEEIRKLGDRLAVYVKEQGDKRFFLNFYKVQRYDDFRTLLIRASYKNVKTGKAPLIELDPYLSIFEEGYEVMRPDWKFARDLVLIRMIESLHASNWLEQNLDALPDNQELDTAFDDNTQ